jgi:hypothetical protein
MYAMNVLICPSGSRSHEMGWMDGEGWLVLSLSIDTVLLMTSWTVTAFLSHWFILLRQARVKVTKSGQTAFD